MVIAFSRMQFWTFMVVAATLDSIFTRNQNVTTERGPILNLVLDRVSGFDDHGASNKQAALASRLASKSEYLF